jgi:hypothetical protein
VNNESAVYQLEIIGNKIESFEIHKICHSGESPRRETPEDEVLRDASEGYRGRNYTDSSFASLRGMPQNDKSTGFSKVSNQCRKDNKINGRPEFQTDKITFNDRKYRTAEK